MFVSFLYIPSISKVSQQILLFPASEKKGKESKDRTQVDEQSQLPEGEDELALLSRRISLAAVSDESSTMSAVEDGYNSDMSQEVTSMADGDLGDMEDNQRDSSAPEDEQLDFSDRRLTGRGWFTRTTQA